MWKIKKGKEAGGVWRGKEGQRRKYQEVKREGRQGKKEKTFEIF